MKTAMDHFKSLVGNSTDTEVLTTALSGTAADKPQSAGALQNQEDNCACGGR